MKETCLGNSRGMGLAATIAVTLTSVALVTYLGQGFLVSKKLSKKFQADRKVEAIVDNFVDYFRFALQNRWCLQGNLKKKTGRFNGPDGKSYPNCNLKDNRSLERLYLHPSVFEQINASGKYLGQNCGANCVVPYTKPELEGEVDLRAIVDDNQDDHPMYDFIKKYKYIKSLKWKLVNLNKDEWQPKGDEAYIGISLKLSFEDPGGDGLGFLFPSEVNRSAVVIVMPRQLNNFVYLSGQSLILDHSTDAKEGENKFRSFLQSSWDPEVDVGIRFHGPVYANGSIVLEDEVSGPEKKVSPVYFEKSVYLGTGKLQVGSTGSDPVNIGAAGDLLSQNTVFLNDISDNFRAGLKLDSSKDRGLDYIFDASGSSFERMKRAYCIHRKNLTNDEFKRSHLLIKANGDEGTESGPSVSEPIVRNINNKKSEFHLMLGLSHYNFFTPQRANQLSEYQNSDLKPAGLDQIKDKKFVFSNDNYSNAPVSWWYPKACNGCSGYAGDSGHDWDDFEMVDLVSYPEGAIEGQLRGIDNPNPVLFEVALDIKDKFDGRTTTLNINGMDFGGGIDNKYRKMATFLMGKKDKVTLKLPFHFEVFKHRKETLFNLDDDNEDVDPSWKSIMHEDSGFKDRIDDLASRCEEPNSWKDRLCGDSFDSDCSGDSDESACNNWRNRVSSRFNAAQDRRSAHNNDSSLSPNIGNFNNLPKGREAFEAARDARRKTLKDELKILVDEVLANLPKLRIEFPDTETSHLRNVHYVDESSPRHFPAADRVRMKVFIENQQNLQTMKFRLRFRAYYGFAENGAFPNADSSIPSVNNIMSTSRNYDKDNAIVFKFNNTNIAKIDNFPNQPSAHSLGNNFPQTQVDNDCGPGTQKIIKNENAATGRIKWHIMGACHDDRTTGNPDYNAYQPIIEAGTNYSSFLERASWRSTDGGEPEKYYSGVPYSKFDPTKLVDDIHCADEDRDPSEPYALDAEPDFATSSGVSWNYSPYDCGDATDDKKCDNVIFTANPNDDRNQIPGPSEGSRQINFAFEGESVKIDGANYNNTIAVHTSDFHVGSIVHRCFIRSDVKVLAGFLACDELYIEDRSHPLTMIGTFIAKAINISQSAYRKGVHFYNIWHPEAVKTMREERVLKGEDGEDCPVAIDMNIIFAGKNWPIKKQNNLRFCQPVYLLEKSDPIQWTTVDPMCAPNFDGSGGGDKCTTIKRFKRYVTIQMQ